MIKPFFIRTGIITLVFSFLIYLFFYFLNIDPSIIVYFLPFYFGLINVLFITILKNSLKLSFSKFSTKYLLATAIRFLGGLVFVIVFILVNREHAVSFVTVFIILYLLFLIHELLEILIFFRKNQ